MHGPRRESVNETTTKSSLVRRFVAEPGEYLADRGEFDRVGG